LMIKCVYLQSLDWLFQLRRFRNSTHTGARRRTSPIKSSGRSCSR
jgi:hypothetical protein